MPLKTTNMEKLQAARSKVHDWVNRAEEPVLNALLERAMASEIGQYPPEMVAELEKRWEHFTEGKAVTIGRNQMNERLNQQRQIPNA